MLHSSVASACCAHLLRGLPVNFRNENRRPVPALLVSHATQALLCEVFQKPDLFAGLPAISRRVVGWGPAAEPISLPHRAVVVAEPELVNRLQPAEESPILKAGWTVFTSRLPAFATESPFGQREATAVAVDLKTPDERACWIESLEAGWLFLLPGVLLAVGGAPATLLGQSRLIAGEIRAVREGAARFRAHPRIAQPLCGEGWLACGSAAMAFDPICGDGAGNSVREAILAAAVIRAAARGERVECLLSHYRQRLLAGFHRHLEVALRFYRTGHGGEWWQQEARELERGLTWCAAQLAAEPRSRYRLNGFDLERAGH